MSKIKVIKSGKDNAKPVNFCPWLIDTGEPAPQK
jgi:hypothetical protein